MRPLARLRRPQDVKEKISQAMTGRKQSEETKEKIRQALKGRKKSPEAEAKRQASHAKRMAMTDEEKCEEARQAGKARRRAIWDRQDQQYHRDLAVAWHMPNMELFKDVLLSRGRSRYRKVFDRTRQVSNGMNRYGRIVWPAKELALPAQPSQDTEE